jgi:hypothetical protein
MWGLAPEYCHFVYGTDKKKTQFSHLIYTGRSYSFYFCCDNETPDGRDVQAGHVGLIKEHKNYLAQVLLEKSKPAQRAYEDGHKICRKEAKVLHIEPNIRYRK